MYSTSLSSMLPCDLQMDSFCTDNLTVIIRVTQSFIEVICSYLTVLIEYLDF